MRIERAFLFHQNMYKVAEALEAIPFFIRICIFTMKNIETVFTIESTDTT